MGFDLSNYVPVNERIVQFYQQFPNGRIAAEPPIIREIGSRTFIEVTASVYRDAEDEKPCVASAWEEFPGKTPYTKDSEMMNAETSAIGRALAAAGVSVNRSMASREEVRNRGASDAGYAQNKTKRTIAPKPAVNDRPASKQPTISESEAQELITAMADAPAEERRALKTEFMNQFGTPHNLLPDKLKEARDFIEAALSKTNTTPPTEGALL